MPDVDVSVSDETDSNECLIQVIHRFFLRACNSQGTGNWLIIRSNCEQAARRIEMTLGIWVCNAKAIFTVLNRFA